MKNVHKTVPAFVSSEGRNGFFGYGGDSFYNLTVTMPPPDTFFHTTTNTRWSAAGHALEVRPGLRTSVNCLQFWHGSPL